MKTTIGALMRLVVSALLTVNTAGFAAGAWGAPGNSNNPPAVSKPSLDISSLPLFLGGVFQPNLMLTLDNSRSMGWSFFPDSLNSATYPTATSLKWNLAALNNPLAYDPNIVYDPPTDAYGNALSNSSFTAAPADGYNAAGTCKPVLSTSYQATWTILNPRNSPSTGQVFHDRPADAPAIGAYYVEFDTSKCTLDAAHYHDDTCYTSRAPTTDAERQNFAN
jgi:type IV pilus assembly protein PilY1